MRAPIYLFCAALAVAVQSEENQNYMGLEPVSVDADPETINYLLPKLAAKYRPSTEWRGVTDPRFYVLTEMESNDIENQRRKPKRPRNKRYSPTLSIQSHIHALQNLLDQENFKQRVLANQKLINKLTGS